MFHAESTPNAIRPLRSGFTTASVSRSGGEIAGRTLLAIMQTSVFALGIAHLLIAFAMLSFAQAGEQENEKLGPIPRAEAFDAAGAAAVPSLLPRLDSIGARTNIVAFLQRGVPAEVRLAALRRAWMVDPAIRDFKGLQDSDWNFNDPNSIPGFGEIGADADIATMLARIVGEELRLVARQPRHSAERTASSLTNAR
jgi:hypothetical protein